MEGLTLSPMAAIELGGVLAVILGGWWWVKASLNTLATGIKKLIREIESLETANQKSLDVTMSAIRKVLETLAAEQKNQVQSQKTIELALKDIASDFKVIAVKLERGDR